MHTCILTVAYPCICTHASWFSQTPGNQFHYFTGTSPLWVKVVYWTQKGEHFHSWDSWVVSLRKWFTKMFLQKSEHFKGKFPTKTFVFLTWRQVKQPPLPSLASSSYSALWVQFLAQPSLVLLRTWMVWGSPSKELPSNKSRRAILKIVVYAKGIQVFVNGHL